MPQALALGAQDEGERSAQGCIGDVVFPAAVEADEKVSPFPQRLERAGEVLHRDQGTYSSAPEADFARTPVASGLWRAVVITAATAKAAAVRTMAPTLCGSVI